MLSNKTLVTNYGFKSQYVTYKEALLFTREWNPSRVNTKSRTCIRS